MGLFNTFTQLELEAHRSQMRPSLVLTLPEFPQPPLVKVANDWNSDRLSNIYIYIYINITV